MGQTLKNMYLLNESLSWSTFPDELPEPMAAHCTVQINETSIAFIGGVSNVGNIKGRNRIENIHVWNDGNWDLGPV